ncbi:GNAT family N-acetyltransferase [Flagellimonas sp.]|jgi:ribosomal protein S18 acetylase RimI-like enzyme|uniref:GNAT family N-acetyltransferase n=1 Tax=Flagellimonas sp. TaxID=2058762 RepID=UPI003BACD0C5
MPLHLRECDNTDLETLVKISKKTFAVAFEKDNNPDDFQSYIQEAFHPSKLAAELANENCLFHFVYDDEVLVGYFKLNIGTAQTDVHDPNALEIERIYVLENHQGKTIGSWMLQQIIFLAKSVSKEFIWLGVWEHNPKAISFYKRHGFTKFDEHPYYIGSDKQTDWLMRLEL